MEKYGLCSKERIFGIYCRFRKWWIGNVKEIVISEWKDYRDIMYNGF